MPVARYKLQVAHSHIAEFRLRNADLRNSSILLVLIFLLFFLRVLRGSIFFEVPLLLPWQNR